MAAKKKTSNIKALSTKRGSKTGAIRTSTAKSRAAAGLPVGGGKAGGG